MPDYSERDEMVSGRSPHGERGLKLGLDLSSAHQPSRSPHGERGLKYRRATTDVDYIDVALLTESVD